MKISVFLLGIVIYLLYLCIMKSNIKYYNKISEEIIEELLTAIAKKRKEMKKYVKCTCICHEDATVAHIQPCCEDGYIEEVIEPVTLVVQNGKHGHIVKN